ncbi:MAG: hypothetical protein Q4G59_10975, partial [Planctomycetia bacterium]|nr:hypothetical protein [Planctomycetia bacterium]
KEVESQVKSSDQITAEAGSRFAVFDPKTKTIAGNGAASTEKSKTAQNTPAKSTSTPGKPDAKSSDSQNAATTPDLLAQSATQWQAPGTGSQQEREQKWAEDAKAAIPEPPKVEQRRIPSWDDPVAMAPPITDPLSSVTASSSAKQETKKQSPPASAKSDQVARSDKNATNNKAKEQQVASIAKAKPESDVVVKQGDKIAKTPSASDSSESFTPIAIATQENMPKKDTVKGKAPAPLSIASAKPDAGKAGSVASPDKAPVVQPLAAAKSPVPMQSLSGASVANAQTSRTTAARGQLVVDPNYSGKAWVPPRTSQPVSASLIRTEIPQVTPEITPANYSTPISKTVGRFPTEVRFEELGEVRRHEPTPVRNTTSRPTGVSTTPAVSSTIALPSSVQTVRVLDATTPEDFARSRNMDRARYTRFYEYNKHKLDSSGSFPAKTLLFVPD